MSQIHDRTKPVKYIVIGFLLWVIIDLGTAGGFRLSYLTSHGPLLLVFYIGYPLVFAYLIFRRNWRGWRLFLATAVAILAIEGAFTRKPFVIAFPLMLVGIPLAICVYAPLTYFPLWIVDQDVGMHRAAVVSLSMVVIVIACLTTFGAGP